jgi:hypothetical protein
MSVTRPRFVCWRSNSPCFVCREKIFNPELAEIGQRCTQFVVTPVPPCELGKTAGNLLREPAPHDARRIAGDDGVGGHVLCDDGTRRDHRAGADIAARQHDRAMADPDVVPDMDVMLASPVEEIVVVALAFEVGARAVGKVRLRGAVHRMIAGIDARHRRDRAEFPDGRVGDLRVVHDVGVIAYRHFMQDRACADLGIAAESGLVQLRRGIDGRLDRERFGNHGASAKQEGRRSSSSGLMTMS